MMLFWYFKDSDPSLIGYSDIDCVANADDRKKHHRMLFLS